MSTTIAELVVQIGVDADSQAVQQLDTSVKKAGISAGDARAGLNKFGKGVAAVSAVVAGAVVGLVKMASSTAGAADEIIKGARRAGVGGQEFQRLAFAAEEADISQQALIKTSSQFAIMMRDAAKGDSAADGFVEALGDIGVKLTDIEGKSRTQQFGIIADQLNKVEDASMRTAIAAEIFGKRYGPELANLLASGSEGINEVSGSLRNVFTDEQFAAAEEYNDAVTEMRDAFEHVKTEATAGLLPVMTKTVDRISAFIDENEKLIEQDLPAFMERLAETLGDVADLTVDLIDDTQAFAVEMERVGDNTDLVSVQIQDLIDRFKILTSQVDLARKAMSLFSDEEETVSKRGVGEGVETVRVRGSVATGEERTENERAKMVANTKTVGGLRAIATNTNLDLKTRKAAAAKERQLIQAESGLKGLREVGAKFGEVRQLLAQGRVAPGDVATAPPASSNGKRRGGGGGKKRPTLDELVNQVAGGMSADGGGPVPHVAIAITNNNNFDFDITQEFSRSVTPDDVGRPVLELIQREINKGNVEASRTIAPIVLR